MIQKDDIRWILECGSKLYKLRILTTEAEVSMLYVLMLEGKGVDEAIAAVFPEEALDVGRSDQ